MKTLLDLTERETRALALIEHFRFLTTSQVEALLFDGTAVAAPSRKVLTRRALHSLLSGGLIGRTPRLIGGSRGGSTGHAYFVRRRGFRLPKGTYSIRHAVTVADVAIALGSSARTEGHELVSFDPEPGFGRLKPDAWLIYATQRTEYHAFLEVDMGTMGSRVFREKIEQYLRLHAQETLDPWPKVLTVTVNESRASLLRRTAETLRIPRSAAFFFGTLEHMKANPLGEIWQVAGQGSAKLPLFRERTGDE